MYTALCGKPITIFFTAEVVLIRRFISIKGKEIKVIFYLSGICLMKDYQHTMCFHCFL